MRERPIHTSELPSASSLIRAGDLVLLSGEIYTARDAAHKKFFEMLDRGEELSIPVRGSVIYYAGPTPPSGGTPAGSCGPTTSGRMDVYAPRLIDMGLSAMIGKGGRNSAVCEAIIRNGAVYFCAVGGAGAFYAKQIEKIEEVMFQELGCESVKRMTVRNMPLIAAIDAFGGNLFADGGK